MSGETVNVTLSCTGGAGSTCSETVQLVVVETLKGSKIVAIQAKKPKTKKRTVVVGSGSATLAGGQSTVLSVKLNGTGKKLLAKYKTLHAALKVTQAVAGHREDDQDPDAHAEGAEEAPQVGRARGRERASAMGARACGGMRPRRRALVASAEVTRSG